MSKELLAGLESRGLIAYGAVIPAETVREILDLELPEYGTKAQFDAVSLAELGAIDYVRKVLLRAGMYLAGHNGNYRILLPSENLAQVDAYMRQADRKLHRAQLLRKNTPSEVAARADQTTARILMRQESRRSSVSASARP